MILLISIRFLDNRYHGRGDGGEPEWPPSPYRVYQAMLAGAKSHWSDDLAAAFKWVEELEPPQIRASVGHQTKGVLTYVPNNNSDDGGVHRTPKMIRPRVLPEEKTHVEYMWKVGDTSDARRHASVFAECARRIRCVGWGIDMAIGNGLLLDTPPVRGATWQNYHLLEISNASGVDLRVPRRGSLESLENVYANFLNRIQTNPNSGKQEIYDYPGAGLFRICVYATSSSRPYCAFELYRLPSSEVNGPSDDEPAPTSVSPRRIKALVGMIRGMFNTPRVRKALTPERVDQMLLGHPKERNGPRLSILPLLSVGHQHAGGRIRRVLFAEPFDGDGTVCHLLSEILNGQTLIPERNDPGPTLQLVQLSRKDPFLRKWYVGAGTTWASVSPVLLPGFDHRGGHRQPQRAVEALGRAEQLVLKSLAHASISAPRQVEISSISWWPGVPHARDFVPRDKLGPAPRYHVKLTFAQPFEGPLSLGRQRHMGLGVFAKLDA